MATGTWRDAQHMTLVETDTCGFVDAPFDDWRWTEGYADVEQRCKAPAVYRAVSATNGKTGKVCARHAAHMRACARCLSCLALMEGPFDG